MTVSHFIVFVPVLLAGLSHIAVCQELDDPYQPVASEEATDGRPLGPTAQARRLITAPPQPMVKKWYGGSIIAGDLATVAAAVLAITSESVPLAGLAGVSYLVTPAVIHGVHGRGGLSAASVLLRIGLPIVGVAISSSMAHCPTTHQEDDAFCGWSEGIIGAMVGVVAASVVDASLAWESTPNSPSVAQSPARNTTPHHFGLLSASVVPSANGASVMLGGRF